MIDSRPFMAMLQRLHEDGVTDAEIARRVGFSTPAIRYIRVGITQQIHAETANALANLLERKSA